MAKSGGDDLYRLIKEEGKHLAKSKDTEGAFRGVYLDDDSNRVCGAGQFVPVKSDEESDGSGISPEAIAALIALCVAAGYGIAKAVPYVKKWKEEKFVPWFNDSLKPWAKRSWNKLRGKQGIQISTEEINNQIETSDVEISNDVIRLKARERMTEKEAQKELIDAYVLIICAYKKANRVANAEIITPSGELVDGRTIILDETVIAKVNAAIKKHPKLINTQQRRELSEVLGYDVFQQGKFVPITTVAVKNAVESD